MSYEQIAKKVGDAPFDAQQKWTELRDLLEFIAPLKPKNILEIGVYKGGTLMAWTHIAARDANITGVDLPGGDFGGGFDKRQAAKIRKLAKYDQKITLHTLDSHMLDTVELVRKGAPYDFIFVDADHTYKGVKQDYTNYYPMLAKGGVMAFHDISKMNHVEYPGAYVHKFWVEAKRKHNFVEFEDLKFDTDHGIWGGIGCLLK